MQEVGRGPTPPIQSPHTHIPAYLGQRLVLNHRCSLSLLLFAQHAEAIYWSSRGNGAGIETLWIVATVSPWRTQHLIASVHVPGVHVALLFSGVLFCFWY